MRKINLLFCLALTATMFMLYACGTDETTTAQPETPTSALLSDDGTGVIFTNTSVDTNNTAQFKLYDNDLRAIINGETFPNSQGPSNYHLEYVRFMLVIFGLDYHGTTISQITCEKSEAQALQLHFADYEINGISYTNNAGIPWTDLRDVQGAPIIERITLPCSGDGKNFEVTAFENNGISDDQFTLYFDFKGERLFRGKLVVTETGKNAVTDGVALSFQ